MGLRDNKLLRSKLQAQAKNKYTDNQPTPDEQLTRLEDDIRRLRVEFDIFFNGGAKRPPYDTKGRVETLLKRLGDDRTLTYAQRYRYNSLAARYNAFRDLWRRTMQGREEGRDPVSAARANVKKETMPQRLNQSRLFAPMRTMKSKYSKTSTIRLSKRSDVAANQLKISRFPSFIA